MGITEEKISRGPGMVSYRCQVLSFENKMRAWKPGRIIRLKSFYVNGIQLRLQLYPNGRANAERNFTSMFVENMGQEDIKIDCDLSIGGEKMSLNADTIRAGESFGWPRFYDHAQHNFAQNDSDSEPEDNDENLEIVLNIKRVWKDFSDGEKTVLETKVDKIVENQTAISVNQLKIKAQLETKINNLEVQMREMMQEMKSNASSRRSEWRQLGTSDRQHLVPKPECPVCMEELGPGTRIMQCGAGHLLCWGCSQKPEVTGCPTCREPFTGRAHGMEAYLKMVFK